MKAQFNAALICNELWAQDINDSVYPEASSNFGHIMLCTTAFPLLYCPGPSSPVAIRPELLAINVRWSTMLSPTVDQLAFLGSGPEGDDVL